MAFWKFLSRGQTGEGNAWGQAPRLQPGEVVRLQTNGAHEDSVFLAKVSVIGLRRIFLDLEEKTLIPRQPLTLFFERGEALYHFETRLIGPARRGAIAVAWPRRIVRLQRRQFYRLMLESPTTFRVMNGVTSSAPLPARLVNLSGGGALLAVAKPLPAGVFVSVRVPAGKHGDPLPIDAETLDCQVTTQGGARVFFARLRFLSVAEDDRDAIIAFLHEQQRILLRNRKLLRA